ncbi:hypothetical protein CYMTET_17584 [Cymbomonas tetramitiformis]|uniref:Uncharacterized protein n=1 Tax=Cymbomonas tetramitiformis TaxID=36881 RepID=A0AAE0G9N0_9CHLO|nr:hypothetical protein CYMTET_17584 [Cymbomonas tetramitiformis]
MRPPKAMQDAADQGVAGLAEQKPSVQGEDMETSSSHSTMSFTGRRSSQEHCSWRHIPLRDGAETLDLDYPPQAPPMSWGGGQSCTQTPCGTELSFELPSLRELMPAEGGGPHSGSPAKSCCRVEISWPDDDAWHARDAALEKQPGGELRESGLEALVVRTQREALQHAHFQENDQGRATRLIVFYQMEARPLLLACRGLPYAVEHGAGDERTVLTLCSEHRMMLIP